MIMIDMFELLAVIGAGALALALLRLWDWVKENYKIEKREEGEG